MLQTPVLDGSQESKFRKVRTTNSTQTGSFASVVPQVAAPSESADDGTVRVVVPSGWVPTRVMVVPFGVGSNDNTLLMRVWGWSEQATLWVPTLLWQGTCTLTSYMPGVAATSVDATNLFCDTIETTVGNDGVDCQPFSPGNDTVGHLILDTKGCPYLRFLFNRDGSATSANALVRSL